eukprot:6989767-Pyramimonas_sp.AAC.1
MRTASHPSARGAGWRAAAVRASPPPRRSEAPGGTLGSHNSRSGTLAQRVARPVLAHSASTRNANQVSVPE